MTEKIEWQAELVEPKHPALHTKATLDPFESDVDWVERQQAMFQIMHENIGIGLASPQCGDQHRMFVMTHSTKGDIGIFNPVILAKSETSCVIEEGCLTFPLLYLIITRPDEVVVRYQTADATVVNETLNGLDARVFQHELDHLEGVLFIDSEYASDLKLKRAFAKREKTFKKIMEMKVNG
jgi:peptide deformylase